MFGSMKSIAKSMVKSYLRFRVHFPELTKSEVLRKTLEARYPPNGKFPITWNEVEDYCTDIKQLTFYVVHAESQDMLLNTGDRFDARVHKVVNQVIERFIPEELM